MRVLAWPVHSPTNPYTPLLYSHLGPDVKVEEFSAGRVIQKYSVWHVHWPESLLNIRNPWHAASKLAGFFAALDCLRARGAKLVWTVHNCGSHERHHPSLEPWFWREFIPWVDGVISLSPMGLTSALNSFPELRKLPAAVIPHGHYRSEYPARTRDARNALGISPDAEVILFVGAIRAYKNVDGLVRAFLQLKKPRSRLYVVGRPNSSTLAERILREALPDDRVHLRFEFLAPEELSAYIGAADVVVLPYREILNSGSALLALSLNRPVLVPARGAMGELKSDFGEEWVQTYSGDLDGAVLEGALDWALRRRPSLCPMPGKYEWQSIGRETARFYHTVSEESR